MLLGEIVIYAVGQLHRIAVPLFGPSVQCGRANLGPQGAVHPQPVARRSDPIGTDGVARKPLADRLVLRRQRHLAALQVFVDAVAEFGKISFRDLSLLQRQPAMGQRVVHELESVFVGQTVRADIFGQSQPACERVRRQQALLAANSLRVKLLSLAGEIFIRVKRSAGL